MFQHDLQSLPETRLAAHFSLQHGGSIQIIWEPLAHPLTACDLAGRQSFKKGHASPFPWPFSLALSIVPYNTVPPFDFLGMLAAHRAASYTRVRRMVIDPSSPVPSNACYFNNTSKRIVAWSTTPLCLSGNVLLIHVRCQFSFLDSAARAVPYPIVS